MFKLLIVDDEDITREGIIGSLDWHNLNIGLLEQADDGVNALEKALVFEPDIVMTDVRMPRMDGIELSFKLREYFPDCKIIFMSGYSDKEYLKSAILLKAVNYVEKPLNINELTQAVRDAVDMCREAQYKKQMEARINTSMPLLASELALLLIKKNRDHLELENRIKAAGLKLPQDGIFTTVLVRVFPDGSDHLTYYDSIKSFGIDTLGKICSNVGFRQLSACRDDGCIIIHLYADLKDKHLFTTEKLKNLCCEIGGYFDSACKYFIAVGKKVQGISNTHESYETAVFALQKVFFRGYNSIIFYREDSRPPFSFEDRLFKEFKSVLEKENREQTIFFIKNMASNIKCFENTLVDSTKNSFFRLLLDLNKTAEKHGLEFIKSHSETNHFWEHFLKLNTLTEIEDLIIGYVNTYFDGIAQKYTNSRLVNDVIHYIKRNYHDENLSIVKISENVHLAPTYLCSLFKEKTGKTLNQYITEVRIEKSKELLLDKKLKISDIASSVGLKDRNYFAKLFRKITGITPSDYK